MRSPEKRVFVSYSHDDAACFQELKKRLAPLQRETPFQLISDRDIRAGSSWPGELFKDLEEARAVLLLISRSYLLSEYCLREFEIAVLRKYLDGLTVVPILVAPCGWKQTPFLGRLQFTPRGPVPISEWSDPTAAWEVITDDLRPVIHEAVNRKRWPMELILYYDRSGIRALLSLGLPTAKLRASLAGDRLSGRDAQVDAPPVLCGDQLVLDSPDGNIAVQNGDTLVGDFKFSRDDLGISFRWKGTNWKLAAAEDGVQTVPEGIDVSAPQGDEFRRVVLVRVDEG